MTILTEWAGRHKETGFDLHDCVLRDNPATIPDCIISSIEERDIVTSCSSRFTEAEEECYMDTTYGDDQYDNEQSTLEIQPIPPPRP